MILRCINAGSCKLLTQDKLYYGEELRDKDGCNTYYKIKRDDGSVNRYKSHKFKEIKLRVLSEEEYELIRMKECRWFLKKDMEYYSLNELFKNNDFISCNLD